MRISSKKLILSILLGLAGFFGSLLSLHFDNPPFSLTITWSYCFPLLAGMIYGPLYGLIAGTLGLGAFFPFVLFPNNGWACLTNSLPLLVWYVWYGYFAERRSAKPSFWNHPLFLHWPFAVFYVLFMRISFPIAFSLNPPFWNPQAELAMPIPVLESVITKGLVVMYLVVIFNVCILKIPAVRKILGVEVRAESRHNGWIVLGSLSGAVILWWVYIIFNRIFIDKNFPQGLLQAPDAHEILALVLFLPAGAFMAVVICQYVESRYVAESELEKSRENYRLIFEQAADGIFLLDAQGHYVDVNESGCQLLGYTREEILRLRLGDVVMPDEKDDVTVRLGALNSGEMLIFERRMRHKDGSAIPVEISARKLADGRLQGLVRDTRQRMDAEQKAQVAQDELQRILKSVDESRRALLSVVEDQKEAEEKILRLNAELEQRVADRTAQLTAANQELEAFTYSVSHDLRAPLRSLDGFSDLLMTDYAAQLDEQGQNFLRRIQENSHRMGQLITDLLKLSRITRVEINPEPVNLALLAKNILTELQAQAPQRQVAVEIAADLPVEGDADLLKIALENLLSNAFKFTSQREQAAIQVGCRERNGERVFFVSDNGTGFDMEYAGKLFAPFQRLHSPKEYPGTGIGLSIVHRIITRHGGCIWPESEVGKGTTFYFTLRGRL